MQIQKDVLIIGGGPAGMSAAIWCQRLGLDHLLVEANRELGGQLFQIHNPVIDYPGLVTENGRQVQQVFAEHVDHLACMVQKEARVLQVDAVNKTLHLQTADGETQQIGFRGFILATGSSERRLHVPGEPEMIARGEVYSASRDRERFAGKRVAVVGGGDRAFEGALLLAESGAQVVLIHRSDRFRARDSYVNPALLHPQIEVVTHARIAEIRSSEKVTGVLVEQQGLQKEFAVEAIFVRIGVEPSSHLLRGQVETDEDGYVVTDEVGRTNCDGVFAVGDVRTRPLYSSIVSAVGQGMIAAKQLSLFLAQKG